ncbi:MAG: hypothetical protein AAF639_34755, partial [Chloroflexota bacterium]
MKQIGPSFPVPLRYDSAQWLQLIGLNFNPFLALNAADDPNLGHYLIHHDAFYTAWQPKPSLVFAPTGGGKTALRVRAALNCYIGQEANNRPFPIMYSVPFSRWGHAKPSFEDHVHALICIACAQLLISLAYRPHWFERLTLSARQSIIRLLRYGLPGMLEGFLAFLGTENGFENLKTSLNIKLNLPEPPAERELLALRQLLSETSAETNTATTAMEANHDQQIFHFWQQLIHILLVELRHESIYILIDDLDAAPETANNPCTSAEVLRPLFEHMHDWAQQRI